MIDLDARAQKLVYLLDQVDARGLALPDFQRSLVWRPDATARDLPVSTFSTYPSAAEDLDAGAVVSLSPANLALRRLPTMSDGPQS